MSPIEEKESSAQTAVEYSARPDDTAGPVAASWLAVFAIAASIVAAYSNTLDASFQFDDIRNIVLNEKVRDLRTLWPPQGTRDLGFLSFALNYQLGGLRVVGYHLVNLAIHVCNGLLVFWLARITLRTPALRRADTGPLVRRYLPVTAALLFAVHPIQTEAVTYVVQRFTSLATLFYLVSVGLYVTARLELEADRPSKTRAVSFYFLSIAAAAASMKTKEISFTLPFVAAGYEFLFFRPRPRLAFVAPLAAAALLVPLGLGTAVLRHGQSLASVLNDAVRVTAETQDIPRSVYLLTQSRVVVTYLRLLLLPVRQNLDYDYRLSQSLADPEVPFALAVLAAVAALSAFGLVRALRARRAAGVLSFFGIAWLFVTLSVESSVIPIRDVIFEHRMYLPSVGAVVALGTLLLSALERLKSGISPRIQVFAALLATAGPLGAATYARNIVWKDELTLWGDVVAKSPAKPRGHEALGLALLGRGATDEAIEQFLLALYPESAHGPGGDDQRAAVRKEIADRIGPARARDVVTLAGVYEANGQLDDAIREYREATRLDASMAGAHANLGRLLAAKGQLDDAIREYREAIRLDPGAAISRNNLGGVYYAVGQFDAAVREYREAIRLDPSIAAAHMNLGTAYHAKGLLDDAMQAYREAIRIDPSKAGAHVDLGAAYHDKGRIDDAIREYREAIRLDSSLAAAHGNLAVAYEAKGQLDDAAREYREARRLRPQASGLDPGRAGRP